MNETVVVRDYSPKRYSSPAKDMSNSRADMPSEKQGANRDSAEHPRPSTASTTRTLRRSAAAAAAEVVTGISGSRDHMRGGEPDWSPALVVSEQWRVFDQKVHAPGSGRKEQKLTASKLQEQEDIRSRRRQLEAWQAQRGKQARAQERKVHNAVRREKRRHEAVLKEKRVAALAATRIVWDDEQLWRELSAAGLGHSRLEHANSDYTASAVAEMIARAIPRVPLIAPAQFDTPTESFLHHAAGGSLADPCPHPDRVFWTEIFSPQTRPRSQSPPPRLAGHRPSCLSARSYEAFGPVRPYIGQPAERHADPNHDLASLNMHDAPVTPRSISNHPHPPP